MKYNVNIHSANPLYFIIDKIDTLKKKNGNTQFLLLQVKTEVLTKYTEFWNNIKNLIETVNGEPGGYGKT